MEELFSSLQMAERCLHKLSPTYLRIRIGGVVSQLLTVQPVSGIVFTRCVHSAARLLLFITSAHVQISDGG